MIPKSFLNAIAHEHYLSPSEQEALNLAMTGKSTAAMADELGISGDAVRKRLSEVYQKFQISGRGPVKLTKLQQLLMTRYQQEQGSSVLNDLGDKEDLSLSRPSKGSTPTDYWGEAPDNTVFFGRQSELHQLTQWLTQDRCRLVAVLGMAGVGKTALAVHLARQIQEQFEAVVWLSLRQAPPLEALLKAFEPLPVTSHIASHKREPGGAVAQILQALHRHRYLVVLDGVEAILQSGRLTGTYREDYQAYGELLQRVAQEPHQSTVLVTSQEKPLEVARLEGERSSVRSLTLSGLDDADALLLLQEKGLAGAAHLWRDLIQGYRGNPFMLQMVATTIREVFDGDVKTFLKTTLFTHDISDYIETALERLSEIEIEILQQLAQQQPMAMADLIDALPRTSPQALIAALQSLKQRSLLETSEGRFSLPPAVLEVVAADL
ncbi:MAG: NB-ARC domain-containing protein [Cyanobacteria bacterium P01_A01_bin.135]